MACSHVHTTNDPEIFMPVAHSQEIARDTTSREIKREMERISWSARPHLVD
jgi:hypothetical protein